MNKIISFKLLILVFFLLSFIATMISAYVSLDSLAYQRIFSKFSLSPWGGIWKETREYEIFFLALAKLYNNSYSILWFASIAFISVGLKLFLIYKVSRLFYWSLALYIAYFFVLFDGTVIRVSLAIIIAYWGAWFFANGRYFIALGLLLLSVSCFHYSLAFFSVVVFFNRRSTSVVLIILYPLLVAFWYAEYDILHLSSDLIKSLDVNMVGVDQLRKYLRRISPGAVPYSLHFIALYCGSVLVFLRYRDELTSFERICFNCVFMSVVVLAVFVGATVVQNRVSEMFRFGLVFIFPFYYKYLLEWVKSPFLAAGLIALGLMAYFYKYVVLQGLISWV